MRPAAPEVTGPGEPVGGRIVERAAPELVDLLDHLVAELPRGREALGPLLRVLVDRLGHVPPPVQELVADRLGLAPVEVAGVVSFSTCFSAAPVGRHRLEVCLGVGCAVSRSALLLDTARYVLDLEPGGVTPDGAISLGVVRCLGACHASPAVRLDGRLFGPLTPGELRALLEGLRSPAAEPPDLRSDGA